MGWLLSSDSHLVEPPDLWTSRVPERYRDQVPRVERFDDADWWCFGGERSALSYGSQDVAGLRFEGGSEALDREAKFSDVRMGAYIPEMFVKENESDGVWGSVLYPTTGVLITLIEDADVVTLAARTYNDWVGEFCKAAPDRLRGVALLCTDDIPTAVAELERARNKLGLSAAAISVSPAPDHKYDHPDYEPLWAAAQDLDVPLSLHVGSNRVAAELGEIMSRSGSATVDRFVRDSIGRIIFAGVFERYPRLKVVSVEQEAGWAPWFIWRMDYAYTQQRHFEGRVRFKDPNVLPSDFFARNVFVSFQEDPVAIENRHRIGVDNLLFGNDYPHAESTFPRTRSILDEILRGVPDDERQKIVCDNTARVYGFDVPKDS